MKITHAAYYIIENYHRIQGGITPLKLQKLLYYLKVWGIVSNNKLLDSGQFKAWKNGPVNGYIYHKFKKYGNQPIPYNNTAAPMPKHQKVVTDFILESYTSFDAITLSAMTHQEEPWLKTKKNGVITDSLINQFYSNQPFAKNFPLECGKTYYPVYSDFIYSFIFDFDEDDTAKEIEFDSFEEYKKLIQQSESALNEHFSLDPA